jgi:hypothetical protein
LPNRRFRSPRFCPDPFLKIQQKHSSKSTNTAPLSASL